MRIDSEKCMGCMECADLCPMECIVERDGVGYIEEDDCVECGVCLRAGLCPNDALYMPEESSRYPRVIRAQFSDPGVSHPAMNQGGRGTEEMKTNDVTGRFRRGEFGMALEFGRPGIGTRLTEIEKVLGVLVTMGVELEENNPVFCSEHPFERFDSSVCLHPSILQHFQLADKKFSLLPVFFQVMLECHEFTLVNLLHCICQNPPLLILKFR